MAYSPTRYVDYVTPINAKNLNKSENATSAQSKDIEIISETISAAYDDIHIISDEIVRIDEDITSLGKTVPIIEEKIETKANIKHEHDEYMLKTETSNVVFARQITRYLSFL